MKQKLQTWFSIVIIATLIINLFAFSTFAQQQRPRRMSDVEFSQLAAGTRILPRGYVIVLRLDTRLDSSRVRASDRFYARIDEPITDEAGSMILPANLLVIGHVKEATPAQMGRRSGIIEIEFDRLVMSDGRELPVNGILTSADPAERKKLKIDEEGVLEGGGQLKRNTVFVGGGAAAGAVIGAIAGGAALGAAVGAAAGVVAVLLAKGKEAIVEPGTLIGLELTESLDLTQRGTIPPPRPTTSPTTPPATTSPTTSTPAPSNKNQPPTTTPDPNGSQQPVPLPPPPQEPQLVKVSFVQVERVSGNSILIVATAETTSSGWRVKAEHRVNQDTLEVWVKGTPPVGRPSRVVSLPTVTTTVADPSRAIRRVIVHGLGGDRTIAVPQQIRR
jgi:type IV secretion system protein VirB10